MNPNVEDPMTCLPNKWKSMHLRCERDINYVRKGIHVCDEWCGEAGMNNFIEWSLANGWQPTYHVDRIDSRNGYSPDNCRYVSKSVNLENKPTHHFYEWRGKIVGLATIAKEMNINHLLLYTRLKRGIALMDAVTTSKRVKLDVKGGPFFESVPYSKYVEQLFNEKEVKNR